MGPKTSGSDEKPLSFWAPAQPSSGEAWRHDTYQIILSFEREGVKKSTTAGSRKVLDLNAGRGTFVAQAHTRATRVLSEWVMSALPVGWLVPEETKAYSSLTHSTHSEASD